MQPQLTSPAPQTHPVRAPKLVPPRSETTQPRRRWILVLSIAIIAGAGIYWLLARGAASEQAKASSAVLVRTAAVTAGPVDATIRLTGVTAAENFASLLRPSLRGSRSGFGRDRTSTTSTDSPTITV